MMYRNDPFLHVLSDVMWRFGECGIKKDTVERRNRHFNWMEEIARELARNNEDVNKEQDKPIALENLWLYVLASAFIPIAVLIIELIVENELIVIVRHVIK